MKYILLIVVALICGCSQPNYQQVKVVSKWTQEDYDKSRVNFGNVKFPHAILEDESGLRYWTSLPTVGNVGDTFKVDVDRLLRMEDCNLKHTLSSTIRQGSIIRLVSNVKIQYGLRLIISQRPVSLINMIILIMCFYA